MAQNNLSPYLMQRARVAFGDPVANLHESFTTSDERESSWQAYGELIRKHVGIIIAFFLSVVLTAGYLTLHQIPIYAASATLLIERKAQQLADIQQMLSEPFDTDQHDYYKTQYEILRSKSLAAQAIQEHHLESIFTATGLKSQSRLTPWLKTALPWGKTQPHGAEDTSSPPKRHRDYAHGVPAGWINTYNSMLTIQPVERTHLVHIIFQAADPDLAARLANAHADTYTHLGPRLRAETKQEAQAFLTEKLSELQERVEKSEAALNDYQRSKGIISPVAKDNLVVVRLADLNHRLTEAEAERIGLEAQMRLIRSRTYDAIPAVVSSPLIRSFKEQLLHLEGEYADLRVKYKPGHPHMAPFKAQLSHIQQRLEQEIRQIVAGIESTYLTAQAKEQELRNLMERQKAETLSLNDASVDYAILAREADTNRQLYESVLQRMKEIKMVAALRAPNATVLDRAEVPGQPAGSSIMITLLISVIVGLMGGVGFAFLIEQFDDTFKTPEAAKRALRLPILGIVPDFLSLPPYARRQGPSASAGKTMNLSRVLSHPSCAAVAEIYAKLCTAILLSQPEAAPKNILFTSAVGGEGKTTNVVNTAMMFALSGARVLLIDADVRNPSCHKILGMDNLFGLTEVITGQIGVSQVIRATTLHNLDLLSAGATPPNPTVLVGSTKIHDTLMALQPHYDCICIDSPPVMPVNDAELLSTMVNGVVLIIDGQRTPAYLAKETRARLTYARANLLGIVLNRTVARRTDYAYYYSAYPAPTERHSA
jgi:capsular exopolysaccharide synthesis family protein